MSENNGIAVHIFRGTLKNTIEESYPMHNAFSAGGAGSAMEIARSPATRQRQFRVDHTCFAQHGASIRQKRSSFLLRPRRR
jgi:hypothetical protein